MARASTVTWLSLDDFAAVIGLHPAHFNGVYSATFPDTSCSELWHQYAWQDHGKASREDIARAIHDAEQQLANYVGYNLLPDWVCDEFQRTVAPYRPELYNKYGYTQRGQFKTLMTNKAWLISGGQKAKTLIEANATGPDSDEDGDGYDETLTFRITTTVDACEIHAYHTGHSGADEWEIRPITVTSSAGTAVITFKKWQLVDEDLWEAMDAGSIDGDTDSNFQQCAGPSFCIDVYRIYNDPQDQVEFAWWEPQCSTCGGSGCTACELAAQDGCLVVHDQRRGVVAYHPATWDSDTEEFTASDWAEYREPDRTRLWYYSGWQWNCPTCYQTQMDPYWKRTIAYFAIALLERPLCDCDCHAGRFEHWQEDLAFSGKGGAYQNAQRVLDNPFGTRRGMLYAWNAVNADGRKVAR